MLAQTESRSFLHQLLLNTPPLPFESALLPALFDITREGSTASIGDLVDLIERSQKLAAHILTAANSALYGQEFKVSSLHRAVSLMGVREVRTLALMEGMASILKAAQLPKGLEAGVLWRHQLRTAAVARALASELTPKPAGPCSAPPAKGKRLSLAPDEAYAAGLLHDVGKVIFAAARPDLWEAVDEYRRKHNLQAHEAEEACLGLDHAVIGAEVMHRWQLPMLLTEPVNWHHAPEMATDYAAEARLLAAADIVAYTDIEASGELCGEALALLPEKADAVALGAAAVRGIACVESFVWFMH